MVRRSVADDSYGRAPFAWTIELGEVHALPRAQSDRTVANREAHAVADKDRFDVSRAVTFARVTAAFTRGVISIVSSRLFVSTVIVSCRALTRSLRAQGPLPLGLPRRAQLRSGR